MKHDQKQLQRKRKKEHKKSRQNKAMNKKLHEDGWFNGRAASCEAGAWSVELDAIWKRDATSKQGLNLYHIIKYVDSIYF